MAIRVLATVFVLVALLGVLVSATPLVLVTVLVGGAVGAWFAQFAHWAVEPGDRAPLLTRLTVGAATGLFFPFIRGTEALGERGSHLSVVVILLTTLIGINWIAQVSRQPVPAVAPRREALDPGQSSLRALLERLPLHDLLDEWRCTGAGPAVAGSPSVPARELVLEEIQRRDPGGFRRWLDAGLGTDPRHFIRGEDSPLPTAEPPDEPTPGR
ncbi:hypothetical protein [Geodermatophilus sp. SYSU D00696]